MGIEFNFEELEDALVGISKKMGEAIIDEALDAGADIVLESMNKYVPVDTKALKKSLGEIKKEGSKTNRKIHLGSTSTDRSIVERAYYQEYGNSSMNCKKGMKKSYYHSKDKAIKAIGDSLAENLFK